MEKVIKQWTSRNPVPNRLCGRIGPVLEFQRNIEFAQVYRPLAPVPFSLLAGSLMERRQDEYGITNVRNNDRLKTLLDERLYGGLDLYYKSFDSEGNVASEAWSNLRERLDRWRMSYDTIQQNYPIPLLRYHDLTNSLLLVRRHMTDNGLIREETVRLSGTARSAYLACVEPCSVDVLRKALNIQDSADEKTKLLGFLQDMVSQRLMFSEDDRYLALGVDARGFVAMRNALY